MVTIDGSAPDAVTDPRAVALPWSSSMSASEKRA